MFLAPKVDLRSPELESIALRFILESVHDVPVAGDIFSLAYFPIDRCFGKFIRWRRRGLSPVMRCWIRSKMETTKGFRIECFRAEAVPDVRKHPSVFSLDSIALRTGRKGDEGSDFLERKKHCTLQ